MGVRGRYAGRWPGWPGLVGLNFPEGSIHINDWDRGVHAFWLAARDQTAELCWLIREAQLSIDEWERQREIQSSKNPDPLELAFSTFYLNRTNRSGIVTGGLIGGMGQTGGWRR